MNLKDLDFFRIVYEEKSFNHAAKKVFMTVQGVRRIINNLESELECELFVRSSKGVIPTESGEILYKKSETVIKEVYDIHHAIEREKNKKKRLRITCARGVLNALSLDILYDFINNNPDLEVSWDVMSNKEAREAVLAYESDIGIVVGNNIEDEIEQALICRRKILLVLYEGHPFYNIDDVTLKDLESCKFITMDEDYQIYHDFVKTCHQIGFRPDIRIKTEDANFIFQCCKLQLGVGVVVDFTLDPIDTRGLRVIPIENLNWDVYQVHLKSQGTYSNVQRFIEHTSRLKVKNIYGGEYNGTICGFKSRTCYEY